MAKRKRLALLAAQVDETHQSRFVSGFLQEAFSDDLDVCVFSMYRKYMFTEIREKGEVNIYNLFDPKKFDGIVILKDTIQTADSTDLIEKRIKENFDGPVLVIDRDSEIFPTVFEDDYSGMASIVSHMIEVHGYKDIAYLSGKKWHKHSLSRLHAYEDTMISHGLMIREDRIIHGDFWYTSGEYAVKEWANSKKGLPEAIVCANDEMAIGVCNELTKMGIKIPDDVAVAGFDTSEEGALSPLYVTSCSLPYEEMGRYAVRYILLSLKGIKPDEFTCKPEFIKGQTCGCNCCDLKEYDPRRKEWPTSRMAQKRDDVFNMMTDSLMVQQDLSDFFSLVYSYAYQIDNVRRFSLCLSEPWRDLSNTPYVHMTHNGYPIEMILAVDYDIENNQGNVNTNAVFDTKDLIPYLDRDRDIPTAFFFTPFFFESECFGYAVVNFGDKATSYNESFREWMEDVSRGFEFLRRSLTVNGYQKLMENMRNSKFFSTQERYDSLGPEEKKECDLVSRILDNNILTYVYQPIVRVSDGEIYAYEALMRSATEEKASPLMIVKYAGLLERLGDVEKATFINILTDIENNPTKFGNAKVFLNSIPGVTMDEIDIHSIDDLLEHNADKIVVEFTEEAELNDVDLPRYKNHLEKLGIGIAIDDFGTGYSNINNLLRYMPNVVKIDRFLLTGIEKAPQKQHFVREIIKFCHDSEIMSLAEGIETTEELRTVVHMGVDLIQGYYTGKPAADPISRIDNKIKKEISMFLQEKDDGFEKHVYTAGNNNRVSLSLLTKSACSDIVIGKKDAIYKDISIIGAPNLQTDIHLHILSGYSGEITLENVDFANIKGRPCVDIEEDCEVTLVINGNNFFHGMGIKVAKSSSLTIEGEGNLSIETNDSEFYGIGNDTLSEHGDLIFAQNGKIAIAGSGNSGICIGSAKGGKIDIKSGLFSLRAGGTTSVAVGSFDADSKINISNCNFSIDLSVDAGVGIGSLNKASEVYVEKTSVFVLGSGNYVSGIGTIGNSDSVFNVNDASIEVNLCSNNSACIGSLHGKSTLNINKAGLRLENSGNNALGIGGIMCDCKIKLTGTDTRVNIHNGLDKGTYAKKEDIVVINGRYKEIVNNEEILRVQKFEVEE